MIGVLLVSPGNAQFANPEEVYKTDMHSVREAVVLDPLGSGAGDVLIFGSGMPLLYRNGSEIGTPPEPCIPSVTIQRQVVGDIDGGGLSDVLVVNTDVSTTYGVRDIMWYRNLGGATFSSGMLIYSGAFQAPEIRIQDVDGDGSNDVLALWYEDSGVVSINWFKQLPDGTFGGRSILMENVGTRGFAMADLDGDNIPDLVTNDNIAGNGSVKIWYQQTDGSFSAGGEQSVSGSSMGVWLHDLDQDGAPDLFLGRSLKHLRNNGNGGWEPPGALLTSTIKEGFADINGDGLLDVWGTTESYSGSILFRILNYRLADGNGGLLPTVSKVMGHYAISPAWTDLTGDGIYDLVFCSHDWQGEAGYYTGNGAGGYDGYTRMTRTMTDVKWLGTADMDGDGDKDIIVMCQQDYKVSWLENLGNGKWFEHVIWAKSLSVFGQNVYGALCMDADGNGTPDVLLVIAQSSYTAYATWFLNDGGGEFTMGPELPGFPYYIGVENPVLKVKDIDQDGVVDILVFRDGIWYWRGIPGGGFESPVELVASIAQNSTVEDADIADVDGDGDLDIVGYVKGTTDHVLSFMENNGANVFSAPQAIIGGEDYCRSIKLWDFDEDGDLDVYATKVTLQGGGAWFENVGGYFTVRHLLGPYGTGLVADFDLDGDLDIATNVRISGMPQFKLFENGGTGQFLAPVLIKPEGAWPILAEDMDGDGDLDLIMAHQPNTISIHRNLANSTYRIEGLAFMDLDGNGSQGANEPGLPACEVLADPNIGTVQIDEDGQFKIYSSLGMHSFSVAPPSSAWQATTTTDFDVDLTQTAPVQYGITVGFEPVSPQEAVVLDITGSFLSCAGPVPAWLTLTNTGTTIFSGEVKLPVPTLITPASATPPANDVVGDTMIWQVQDLVPGAHWTSTLQFTMPGVAQQGAEVALDVMAFGQGADPVAQDSIDLVITCGGVSNELLCDPSGSGAQHLIPYATDHLDFTLLFMNTGIDTVHSIYATVYSGPELKMADAQLVGSSAPVEISIGPTGAVAFILTGMQLPPVAQSPIGSQGAFTFRLPIDHGMVQHGSHISTYMTLQMFGSEINSYNTNQVDLIVQDCSNFGMQIRDTVYFGSRIYVPNGYAHYQWYLNGDSIFPMGNFWFFEPVITGSYTVEVTDYFGCVFTTDPFMWISTSTSPELERSPVKVYPNPASDMVRVEVAGALIKNWGLFDGMGRFVARGSSLGGGIHEFHRGDLAPGLYFIRPLGGITFDRAAYPVLFK